MTARTLGARAAAEVGLAGKPKMNLASPSAKSRGRRPRAARWAGSRPSGSRPMPTSPRSRTCRAPGSTGCNARRPPGGIILDMDNSESPTHGEPEGSAWNGYFGCTCYHPLFVFNQFGDLECCRLRPGSVHSAEDWRLVLEPVIDGSVRGYRGAEKQRGAPRITSSGRRRYGDVSSWASLCPSELGVTTTEHRSDRTFGRISTAIGR